MENNKYYTPTIEEFHIGFEYETEDLHDDLYKMVWKPQVYEGEEMRTYLTKEIEDKEIRVKYLDKEDIESLEFKYNEEYDCYNSTNKEGYCIEFLSDEIQITYYGDLLFIGIIKNKSELKKLMKQLGIYEL
jgi:hypothetical protein